MKQPRIAVLQVCGKTADSCSIVAVDSEGKTLADYSGYVPRIFPGGDEDYLDFQIDVATGRILNWPKRMSQKLLRQQLGVKKV